MSTAVTSSPSLSRFATRLAFHLRYTLLMESTALSYLTLQCLLLLDIHHWLQKLLEALC
jgi:hypothetical protein